MEQDAIRRALQREIIVGYNDMLMNVRKSVKGVKAFHLKTVLMVGLRGECKLMDVARDTGRTKNNMHRALYRARQDGLINKDGRVYTLTDKGTSAYNAIVNGYSSSVENIINMLQNEAKKRGKKG